MKKFSAILFAAGSILLSGCAKVPVDDFPAGRNYLMDYGKPRCIEIQIPDTVFAGRPLRPPTPHQPCIFGIRNLPKNIEIERKQVADTVKWWYYKVRVR